MHGCEDGLALVQVTTRGGHTEQPDKDQKSRQMFWEKDQDIATHDRSRKIKTDQDSASVLLQVVSKFAPVSTDIVLI